MGFGNLEFDREVNSEEIDGAINRSELINNKIYNVSELGATNGELILYIDTDTVTNEKAAEILLKTKELMDKEGISFYSVQLVLQHPPYDAEKPYERPDGEINIRKFLYTDIYEENIVERVSKAVKDTEAYYKEQNELKNSLQ